nr:hypothetical protein [Streptomyces sp. DSM 41633]
MGTQIVDRSLLSLSVETVAVTLAEVVLCSDLGARDSTNYIAN